MKTAISMPDDVFERVNDYAQRHHLSRSEVFVIAANQLFDKESRESLSERINASLAAITPSESDRALDQAVLDQSRRMNREVEW